MKTYQEEAETEACDEEERDISRDQMYIPLFRYFSILQSIG